MRATIQRVSDSDQQPADTHAETAALLRLIRSFTTATLLSHDHSRATQMRLVLDPARGGLIAPTSPELLESEDFLLLLPEESDAIVHLEVVPESIDAFTDAGVDRHRAYHPALPVKTWVRWIIRSAKAQHPVLGALVADGEDLMRPSPLGVLEPRLLRTLNAQPDRLRSLAQARTGTPIQSPLAVGIDPDGIDVRARYGVIRVEFDEPLEPATAQDRLMLILQETTP